MMAPQATTGALDPYGPPSISLSISLSLSLSLSLWDTAFGANTKRFEGLVPLLPHLCPLSIPKGGVCGVYSESP